MKLNDHQFLFTWHVGWLIMYANAIGYKLTFGEAHRSPQEQERLYKAGLSQIKVGGNHGKRLAVDFNLFKNVNGKMELTWAWEDYKVLGDYWEQIDPLNRWGGDFNGDDKKNGFVDSPHFERNVP